MSQMIARADTHLKRVLAEQGRRQSWLADRLGVYPSQVNTWVHGIHEPADETKARIAALLDYDVEDLWPPATAAPMRREPAA